jgi:hypothetical protein
MAAQALFVEGSPAKLAGRQNFVLENIPSLFVVLFQDLLVKASLLGLFQDSLKQLRFLRD